MGKWFDGILQSDPRDEFGKSWKIDPPIKIEITQLFYPEDKNLEHFYEVLDKLEKERLKRCGKSQSSNQKVKK